MARMTDLPTPGWPTTTEKPPCCAWMPIISTASACCGNQGEHERHDLRAGVVQAAQRGIQVQSHGAPAAGSPVAVGTEYPVTDCERIAADPLLVDEAVRHQLVCSPAVAA